MQILWLSFEDRVTHGKAIPAWLGNVFIVDLALREDGTSAKTAADFSRKLGKK